MKIAYFDCFCGAAGDMIVASLLDAGADAGSLRAGFESMGVGGYTLSVEKTTKQGFAATRFIVDLDTSSKQPHRHLKDVKAIIERGSFSEAVRDRAIRIFERLAKAEACVHGTTIEKVHFHEVGAVDAILDIVGASLALESLGIERVCCSPIPTGSGTVKCQHGIMPVPAPATAELLKGVPLASCEETGELTTPTGAAILTEIAESFGPVPSMAIESVGCGAGTREGKTRPNILRVLVGESAASEASGEIDSIVQLETNLDDSTPEVIGYCFERLLSAGALDVYTVPIQMKKGRLGVLLSVLCEPSDVSAMEEILFAETSTFGVRRQTWQRSKLSRRWETVQTPFGEVRMKVGERDGVVTASAEFEDCRKLAVEHGVALREVMAAASAAWQAHAEAGR
jgi:pyridinium-3,5-bisthiocarboxylic acid mononucleotide nickel chelatase